MCSLREERGNEEESRACGLPLEDRAKIAAISVTSVPGCSQGSPDHEGLSLRTDFEQLHTFAFDEIQILLVWLFEASPVNIPLKVDHTTSKCLLPHPIRGNRHERSRAHWPV